MKMKYLVILFAAITGLLLATSGCRHASKPATRLEGQWSGFKTARPDYKCTLSIKGDLIEYHGAESNDWVRGTFVLNEELEVPQMDLTIQEPADQSKKVILAIYQIDEDTLRVAAGHSGSPRPSEFAPGPQTDVFNFKRD